MRLEDKLAKLQKLLNRVLARASGPRFSTPVGATATDPRFPPFETSSSLSFESTTAVDRGASTEVDLTTIAPPSLTVHAPAIDERLESRARLVSAPPARDGSELDELGDDDDAMLRETSLPPNNDDTQVGPLVREMNDERSDRRTMPTLANEIEIEEPAPASSRRPIAQDDVEEVSSPRHTPPPESGRQVAAPPIDREFPPPMRRSSVPAPMPMTPPAGGASVSSVATIVGSPPLVAPTTFGEMLEETLSL